MLKYRTGDGCNLVIHITSHQNAIWALAAKPLAKGMFSGIISNFMELCAVEGKQEVIP